MQAEAGYLPLTGEPDGPPSRFGLSIVDQMTGLYAAFALVSGVVSARATGTGRDIDVSLFDAALQNLTYLAIWYLNAGVNQQRAPRSSHPSLTPSQLYKTRTASSSSCATRRSSGRCCATRSEAGWRDRPDYKDFKARLANRDKLTVELDAALSARTTAEWIERFAGTVPAAPVHDVKAALDNAFVADEGACARGRAPRGACSMLAPPVRCPGEEMPCEPAPALGADTDEILGELGFAPASSRGCAMPGPSESASVRRFNALRCRAGAASASSEPLPHDLLGRANDAAPGRARQRAADADAAHAELAMSWTVKSQGLPISRFTGFGATASTMAAICPRMSRRVEAVGARRSVGLEPADGLLDGRAGRG